MDNPLEFYGLIALALLALLVMKIAECQACAPPGEPVEEP